MSDNKNKRVLLKLSGEAISSGKNGILNFDYINSDIAPDLIRFMKSKIKSFIK